MRARPAQVVRIRPSLGLLLLALVVAGGWGPAAARAAEPLPVPYTPVTLLTGTVAPDRVAGANDFSCKPAPGTRPVVLVHGLAATLGSNWATMAPLLKNNGFCVFGLTYGRTLDFPYIGGVRRMDESSAELSSFVDGVLRETGAEKVDLVGHSEGTVMPRWFLSFRGGAEKVDRYVGMTPLFDGTDLAGIGALVDVDEQLGLGAQSLLTDLLSPACGACVQFARGSDYMNAVNRAGPVIPSIRYTSIVTKLDELVIPYTSGIVRAPNVRNIVLQDVCPQDLSEHLAVAYSPNVAQMVLNALAPDRARPVPCVPMAVTGPARIPDVGLEPASATPLAATSGRCMSRRRFTIRVRPTDRPIRSAAVRVDGRRVPTRRAAKTPARLGRRSAVVDLRRFGRRTVTVRTSATLRARDERGRTRTIRDTRRYRACSGS